MHLNVSIKNVTCIQEPHKRFILFNEKGEIVVIIKEKKTDYYFVDTISHDPEQMDVFQKSNFLEKKILNCKKKKRSQRWRVLRHYRSKIVSMKTHFNV